MIARVSIHAPREGCDLLVEPLRLVPIVSIHAPREGCDRSIPIVSFWEKCFNSRTPGGVRQNVLLRTTHRTVVSIHAPREGCDIHLDGRVERLVKFQFTHPGRGATAHLLRPGSPTRRFNSRTPGGVRHKGDSAYEVAVSVSIHAPREGCDRLKASVRTRYISFNSRTPGGVRLSVSAPLAKVSKFQFTHPGRGATGW